MKYLFLGSFLCLVVVSVAWAWLSPNSHSNGPVLYWVTDPTPAREGTIRRFHQWLHDNHYPPIELRLDTANTERAKKIIQGVSGVAGDILDLGIVDLAYFHSIGLLEDVTEDAKQLGFDPSHCFAAIEPELVLDGRQYAAAGSVMVPMYWVNRDTFAKYNLPIPPTRWDFDTFEKVGKAFVAAANPPGTYQKVFFSDVIDRNVVEVHRRSAGLDTFNETLTRCVLDDARYVQVLQRIHRWTFKDHILPTKAESSAFAADVSFGAPRVQLFHSGNFGMVLMASYALVQMRGFGAMNLSISEQPYSEFRNTLVITNASSIYAGSKHKDLAKLFLAFLASEDYNMQVVEDADALPPNPKYVKTAAFLHPAEYPNEWECHEPFAQAATDIAIPPSTSPFILATVVERMDREAFEGFMMSGRLTAPQAARETALRINKEIDRTLRENPKLQSRYDELLRRQKTIDAYRASKKKIPLAWIENPFYRRYYQFKGWTE